MGLDRQINARCIACRGEARRIGEVPYAYHFLQHRFSKPLDSGDLYECSTCGLWFKHPFLPSEQVARFYSDAPDTLSWDTGEIRADFLCAISAISDAMPQGGAVLDFGCYKGEFLRLLPDNLSKAGIEPSLAGSKVASENNIEILGGELSSALRERQFDCITLFDVFEHLTDPLGTLDTLFAHIRPHGLLCVGTGFADSPAFRHGGSKYSYICMPEHSCFLTRRFLDFLADRYQSKYKVTAICKSPPSIRGRLRAATINCINAPMLLLKSKRRISGWYRTNWLRAITSRGLLPFVATEDHAVVVFRK
jgi:SAM-dependent methyltransferase